MKKYMKILFGIALMLVIVLNIFILLDVKAEDNTILKINYGGNDIYYSDNYFKHGGVEYDSHLATLSMAMSMYSINLDNPMDINDNIWYLHQSDQLKGFFDSIKFNNFAINDDYKSRAGFDTVGIALASKKIGDYTVIGIVPRSGGYFTELSNDAWFGDGSKSDYMHEGWYNAANKLIDFLDSYLEDMNITGKVKVWITGYSRGGAIANLAAGLLDNYIDDDYYEFKSGAVLNHDDLYAYTFEALQGANINSTKVKTPKDEIYNNIWNIINPNDLVTKLGMGEFGFTRFGIDKFITTQFYDSYNFKSNRETFKKLYNNDYQADNFVMYGSDFKENNTKNYDANIVSKMVLECIANAIGDRNSYVSNYQDNLKDLLLLLMNDDSNHTELELKNMLLELVNKSFTSLITIDFNSTTVFNNYLDENRANEGSKLYKPLFKILSNAIALKPNELMSLGYNITNVFQNHDPLITFTHMKAQDSYYVDDYNLNGGNIKLVKLIDNVDYGHVHIYGYDDVKVMNSKGDSDLLLDVDGHILGKSDINYVADNIAVGYYSYANHEEIEIFYPYNDSYQMIVRGYSKQPTRTTEFIEYIEYSSINQDGIGKRIITQLKKTDSRFNSLPFVMVVGASNEE